MVVFGAVRAFSFLLGATVFAACTARSPQGVSSASGEVAPVPPDVGEMRVQYAQREDFFDLCEKDRPLAEAAEAINSNEWEAALRIAGPWVERCPVDIDGHLVAAIALERLGRAADAEEHARWYRGLVAAVLATGDGRSAKNPFVVLSVPEEYAILRALGLEPVRQSLLEGGIDELIARDDQGAAHTLYFHPEAHWRRLERAFP